MKNNRFINRLKAQAEENPMMALVIGAAVATAAAKLLDASSERSRARTWEKEVDRRRGMR